MALSSLLIRPPSEAQQPVAGRGRRATAPQGGAAFASVMAGQGAAEGRPLSGGAPAASGRNFVLAGRTPGELIRAQLLSRAQADMRQTKAMEGLMQSAVGNGSTLDLARSMGTARHLRAVNGGAEARFRGLNMGDFVHSRRSPAAQRRARTGPKVEEIGLGQLAARFESGGDGVAAIGYDRNGGTSYGKYQVSSRAGSLGDFLKYLDSEAPDISKRLRASGPGNTGSRKGAMPDTWRAIAKEQPERFEALQEDFVRRSHYKPALESICQRTGLSEDTLSPAMREVIFSTAVQHGPAGAARIFARADAMSGSATDPAYERKLISNVYKIRVGQFGSSTSSVQAAVANRFKQEKQLALNMLDGGKSATLA